MAQGYKRSLRNYLLNSSYQLRFTGVIVVISAILTGGLGYFVMSKAHEASRVVSVQAMDPENLLAQQLATQFAHNDRILMFVLIDKAIAAAGASPVAEELKAAKQRKQESLK